MDLQRFKDKMQTEDALPLNILLDEAQNVVHKNGSMEVDAARELMQDIVDKFGIVKMISKDLRTGEMPVDDNPVKLTYNKVICIEELTELATAIIDYESYCSESDTDETVREHHEKLLNQKFAKGNQIRIIPDTHAGKGCVIGTTITITDKVVPNLVGVDIGCGMLAIK